MSDTITVEDHAAAKQAAKEIESMFEAMPNVELARGLGFLALDILEGDDPGAFLVAPLVMEAAKRILDR